MSSAKGMPPASIDTRTGASSRWGAGVHELDETDGRVLDAIYAGDIPRIDGEKPRQD